jgi:glycosyltransferase involved in cell wall biosynthesis
MIAAMGEPSDPPPTVVVPVFNDWAALQPLVAGLAAASAEGPRPRLVIVDDGSSESGPDLAALAGTGLSGEILRLHHNLGHQGAIAVGLRHVVAKDEDGAIAIMDGDGEDRPENLPRLLAALGGEAAGIVVAERARRQAPLGFRVFYRIYSIIFRLLTGTHLGFGNFCALGPEAARRVAHMPEVTIHLAATLLLSRLWIRRLAMDRGARYDGRSKMSFVALTGHGLRSIAVFGETVLTRIVIAAVWLAGLGALTLLIVLLMKLSGLASPGWTTTVAGVVLGLVAQIVVASLLGLFVIMRGRRAEAQDPAVLAKAMIRRIERFGPSA